MGTNKNVVRDGFLLKEKPLERESTVCFSTHAVYTTLFSACFYMRACACGREDY